MSNGLERRSTKVRMGRISDVSDEIIAPEYVTKVINPLAAPHSNTIRREVDLGNLYHPKIFSLSS